MPNGQIWRPSWISSSRHISRTGHQILLKFHKVWEQIVWWCYNANRVSFRKVKVTKVNTLANCPHNMSAENAVFACVCAEIEDYNWLVSNKNDIEIIRAFFLEKSTFKVKVIFTADLQHHVCLSVRGDRPNRWSDHHQNWHAGRGLSIKWTAWTIKYVTKQEVTSQNQEWRHPCSKGLSESSLGQGNCPIVTKFDTNIEWHTDEMISVLTVTSQNRKWPLGIGSDPLKQEVEPHNQGNGPIATKLGTCIAWHIRKKMRVPDMT